jgi:hypothetical protein
MAAVMARRHTHAASMSSRHRFNIIGTLYQRHGYGVSTSWPRCRNVMAGLDPAIRRGTVLNG